MAEKIFFVTNMNTHYTVKLYELLSQRLDVEYYFTGGEETYTDQRTKSTMGHFKGEYLSGVFLLPKFRFTPKLFSILFRKYDVMIKTIDDRFALPVTFLCAKLQRRPFIFWVGLWHHPQTLFHKVSYLFTKLIYNYSDAIVVYGEHIKQYLITLGINKEKIFCAPHAVDNSFFNKDVSQVEKNEIKAQLNVSEKQVLLYVGRLEPCKGLEYLLEAVSMLKGRTVMVFIGTGSLRKSMEQRSVELNVQSRFLEFIPNSQLYKYYAVADIFILPSISTKHFKEPWGLVVNEAMNQGCPIVATNAVGAAVGGLVEDGKNGFVVQEKNSEELRKAINKLVLDEPLRFRMSAASKEKIRNWTQENMAQGFVDAIRYVKQKRCV